MRELWATWYGRPYKAVHGRTVRTKYTRPEVTFTLRVNQLELLYLKAELDPDVERIRRSVFKQPGRSWKGKGIFKDALHMWRLSLEGFKCDRSWLLTSHAFSFIQSKP